MLKRVGTLEKRCVRILLYFAFVAGGWDADF